MIERLQEAAALRAINDPLATTTRSFAPDVAENLLKELLTTRTVDAVGKMIEIVGQYVEPVQLQVVCLTLSMVRFATRMYCNHSRPPTELQRQYSAVRLL
ncbi:MAG TPA: hypothetical protein VFR47_14015 [Anaerolineales bacterium]|nr:hypothetical protein [Anaerolineales bacterium]